MLSRLSIGRLWLRGLLLWISIALISIPLSFVFFDELRFSSQISSIILTSSFIAYSTYFMNRFYAAYKNRISIKRKSLLKKISIGLLLTFIVVNLIPKTSSFQVSDSPFDKIWYHCPQTYLGFPTPYLRFLKIEVEDVSNPVIDPASLFINIFILLTLVYFISGIYFLSINTEEKYALNG